MTNDEIAALIMVGVAIGKELEVKPDAQVTHITTTEPYPIATYEDIDGEKAKETIELVQMCRFGNRDGHRVSIGYSKQKNLLVIGPIWKIMR